MKKVLFLSLVLALVAVPALAGHPGYYGSGTAVDIEVENDDTDVDNNVKTISNTGKNNVTGGAGNVTVKTGDAISMAEIVNVVNTTEIEVKSKGKGKVKIEVENDDTDVDNDVKTVSNTGKNNVVGIVAHEIETESYSKSCTQQTGRKCRCTTSCSENLSKTTVTPVGGNVSVTTGDAASFSGVTNVVNSTTIKVVRRSR